MATKSEIIARLRERSGWLPGKRIKFDLGTDGIVLLDGVAGAVSEKDGAADTTIRIAWDDLEALGRKELDPLTAMMTGRLVIEGDMSNAMQLQGVIEKLGDA